METTCTYCSNPCDTDSDEFKRAMDHIVKRMAESLDISVADLYKDIVMGQDQDDVRFDCSGLDVIDAQFEEV